MCVQPRQPASGVVGGDDGTVRLWDASSWQPMLGHADTAWAGFFDDGRRIGSGSCGQDSAVVGCRHRAADRATAARGRRRCKGSVPRRREPLAVVWTVDTVQLWDRAPANPSANHCVSRPIRTGTSSPTTQRAGWRPRSNPASCRYMNSDHAAGWGTDLRPEERVAAIAFSRDGRIVATGGNDGTVRLWDSDTGAPIGQPMKGNGSVTEHRVQQRRPPPRSRVFVLVPAAVGHRHLAACRRTDGSGLHRRMSRRSARMATRSHRAVTMAPSSSGTSGTNPTLGSPLTGQPEASPAWTSARTGRSFFFFLGMFMPIGSSLLLITRCMLLTICTHAYADLATGFLDRKRKLLLVRYICLDSD